MGKPEPLNFVRLRKVFVPLPKKLALQWSILNPPKGPQKESLGPQCVVADAPKGLRTMKKAKDEILSSTFLNVLGILPRCQILALKQVWVQGSWSTKAG